MTSRACGADTLCSSRAYIASFWISTLTASAQGRARLSGAVMRLGQLFAGEPRFDRLLRGGRHESAAVRAAPGSREWARTLKC